MIKGIVPLIFLILMVVSGLPFLVSVQAFRKTPPPVLVCFAAVGIDPYGVLHVAYFYRLWMAKKLAATWVSAGWTGVMVGPC
jgi:hypothetical protein